MISNFDKSIFDSIVIDELYITIGTTKLQIMPEIALYNQVKVYFRRNGLENVFNEWLRGDDDVIDAKHIKAWEDRVVDKKKPLIYVKVLRIKRKPGSIEFYGLTEGGMLEFITDTRESHENKIKNYLRFSSSFGDSLCKKYGLEHCLQKTDKLIKQELNLCLLNNLIDEVKQIDVLGNTGCMLKGIYYFGVYDLNSNDELMNQPTPAWDNFINQIIEQDARESFRAWVYSVFVGKNRGRQILWLYGIGNSGKSVITEAIGNELGDNLVSNLPRLWDFDKYTLSSFVAKRLIKAPDYIDRSLLRQQFVKNITGNDSGSVRRMNQEASSDNVYCKIMVTSNGKPFVDLDKPEELSRLIYVGLDQESCRKYRGLWNTTTQGQWDTLIKSECRAFIAQSRIYYDKWLSSDGNNLIQYDTMCDGLEMYRRSVVRDIKNWLDLQIIAKENSKITFHELYEDFYRFTDVSRSKNIRLDKTHKVFILQALKERGIKVYSIEIGNTLYIDGYEFVKEKTTLGKLVKLELLSTEKNNHKVYTAI